MPPIPPKKSSPMPMGKGKNKGLASGSRTTFLSVKKFRMSRVQNAALIIGAIVVIAAVVWSALYFFN